MNDAKPTTNANKKMLQSQKLEAKDKMLQIENKKMGIFG